MRGAVLVGVALVVLVVLGGLVRWGAHRLARPRPAPDSRAAAPAPDPAPERSAPADPGAPPAPPAAAPDGAARPDPPPAGDEALAALAAGRGSWAAVDLKALRAKLPDNVYWTMSAPTTDPDELRRREEERTRWNVEYGKVLSNTATAAEVDAYYAHRQRLSVDYIAFMTELLTDYGERLPDRDIELLKLALRLHMARLEEIPRQITEAQQRREAHEAARRAWQEQQRAFDQAAPPER
jgi:hypothetical protein